MRTDSNWHSVDEPAPNLCAGDRLLCLVMVRHNGGPLKPHLTILEATETGWANEWGLSIEDCELWCLESAVANAAIEHVKG